MKKTISFLILILFPVIGYSQIAYDTLNVTQIGDGIFHYTIEAPSVPWTFNVVEIDITNPTTTLETVLSQDSFAGRERTSSMAQRKSKEGHRVVAAVNGDFHSGGSPTGSQVTKGEILKKPVSREVFGFTRAREMFINKTQYSGNIYVDETAHAIHGINQSRDTDDLIFYNHYYSNTTKTNQNGTEIVLSALDQWVVNGRVRAVVNSKSTDGNAPLTDSTFVLSGHGVSQGLIDNIAIGDTIEVEHKLLPGNDDIKELIGGRGKFIDDGTIVETYPERHPRTAVGFNADTTKAYLLTVDGRQNTSAGMKLAEMGEFMKTFGVANALNLDGGGSTTMVVHHKIENSPSDGGGERLVANSLTVVSSKEKIGILDNVNLTPTNKKTYRGKSFSFYTFGNDANYYRVDIDSSKMQYSLSPGFNATITQDGKFTAGFDPDTGFVYLEYEGYKDTARVIIKGVKDLNVYPKFSVTDTAETISFTNESYDFDGKIQQVSNQDITWELTDPSIGHIENGVFKAIETGATSVVGTFDGVSDTTEVEVRLGEGTVPLSFFETMGDWQLSSDDIDLANSSLSLSDSIATEGSHSLRFDYEFVYDNNPAVWAYFETDIPIFGVPDSINFDAVTDGEKHLFELLVADNDGELFNITVKKWAESTEFDLYPALMGDRLPENSLSQFYYPITIKNIGIKLASGSQNGERYSGSIFLDNLRVVYPDRMSVSNEQEAQKQDIPNEIQLKQNYPNPFNPTTNIAFSVPKNGHIELSVFDVLGRKVATLVDKKVYAGEHVVSFNASQLSSGLYFYKLSAQNGTVSRKMTLIK